jgi:hypothetical protein
MEAQKNELVAIVISEPEPGKIEIESAYDLVGTLTRLEIAKNYIVQNAVQNARSNIVIPRQTGPGAVPGKFK